jgi:hypothetical protein
MSRPVVMGFDGSVESRRALTWAVREARSLRAPLLLVRAYEPPVATMGRGYAGVIPASVVEDQRMREEQALQEGLDAAAGVDPEVEVSGRLVPGGAAAALLTEAEDACLVVLGSRGLGGLRGMLLGSVSQQVAMHARVPVVVLRGAASEPTRGRVVVAVDGSPASREAIGYAFDHAARHSLALHAVHAWEIPIFDAPGVTVPPSLALEEVEDDEVRLTAEALTGWSEKYPDVAVTRETVHGIAERVVVDASEGADLLVVGSRGRGGFAGLLLGSVSQAALHHGRCPVAVVRPH